MHMCSVFICVPSTSKRPVTMTAEPTMKFYLFPPESSTILQLKLKSQSLQIFKIMLLKVSPIVFTNLSKNIKFSDVVGGTQVTLSLCYVLKLKISDTLCKYHIHYGLKTYKVKHSVSSYPLCHHVAKTNFERVHKPCYGS